MTDRARFMSAVRAALGRAQTEAPKEPPPVVEDAMVRLARHDEDLVALFIKGAEEVGMHVVRVSDAQLADQLVAMLKEQGAQSVVTSAGNGASLTEQGFEVVDWQLRGGFDRMFDVDAGITPVQAALAETGTLVCCSGEGFGRGHSLVPQLHFAILRASDILPDMLDYWARYQGSSSAAMPSSIAFITGPSKTADIEGHLIQGVHGPREVFILLVEDA